MKRRCLYRQNAYQPVLVATDMAAQNSIFRSHITSEPNVFGMDLSRRACASTCSIQRRFSGGQWFLIQRRFLSEKQRCRNVRLRTTDTKIPA